MAQESYDAGQFEDAVALWAHALEVGDLQGHSQEAVYYNCALAYSKLNDHARCKQWIAAYLDTSYADPSVETEAFVLYYAADTGRELSNVLTSRTYT